MKKAFLAIIVILGLLFFLKVSFTRAAFAGSVKSSPTPTVVLSPTPTVMQKTTICLLKDNKIAAVSFASDDGFYDSILTYISLFKKYGLKGTVFLVPDWVEGGSGTIGDNANVGFRHGSWPEWTALFNEGYLSIANHSMTHDHLIRMSTSEVESEINGAKAAIEANIPGFKELVLGTPFSETNSTVQIVAAEQHWAARNGAAGADNPISGPSDWFMLRDYHPETATALATMNNWIDTAISDHGWVIESWHGLDGVGWHPCDSTTADAHFSYVASKLNQVWCGTIAEITQYIRERQNAALIILADDTTHIGISLTDTLDNTIFNFPLTLRTEVPAAWQKVKALQNGQAQLLTPVHESGKSYVYYYATPDQGNIDLYPLNTGDAIRLSMNSGSPDVVANGINTTLIQVRIADFNGNTVSTANNQVTFGISGPGMLVGTNPVSAVNGVAGITLQSTTKAGRVTVTAKTTNLVSSVVTVNTIAGPPTNLVTDSSLKSIRAGSNTTATITASICDANGNVVTTANNAITFSAGGTGSLVGTNPVNAINGIATISLKAGNTAGAISTVTAISSGLAQGLVAVPNVGAPGRIICIASPASILSDGKSMTTITAQVCDANGVIVTDAANTILFKVSGPGRLLTDTGDYTRTVKGGIATMHLVSQVGQTGQITVSATSSGITAGTVTVTSI